MSAAIPFGYLSPEGRAAVKARADELQAYLAQRRAERQWLAQNRVVSEVRVGNIRMTMWEPAPAPRDLGPAFSDSVRGGLDVVVSA